MRLGDDRDLGRDEPDALIGTQIGPLTLVRRLTEGGMGSVYLAEHAELHTQQAVKVLSPHMTQNEVLVRRFVNEVRGAALLRHRNLLRAHEIGRLPNGSWFIVFDYVDGQSLGRFIRSHSGPIPLPIVVHVVSEIANGLHAAHAHKIVHRDLKPDNVLMVAIEGDPHHMVVLDLGVALLGDDPWSAPRARSGVVIGTPAYMSAEQLRGDQVTAASDIFALGVIAYQMSTGGWFPYQHGESRTSYCELAATELYHRQMTEPPIDPRKQCSRLGSAWASALLAAVSADLDVRPASARVFALNLADALTSTGPTDGRAIVLSYARELIDGGVGRDPVRAPRLRTIPANDLASRYQLGPKLGMGGMAEVFAGTMIGVEGFARQVAIKRVLPGLSQVPAFAAMFVSEARIVSRLAHPNIVSVLDFSRDLDDRLFLVMEYVDGKDLASLLESGPIPPSLAIFIVVEMLRGLGYAHDLADPAAGTRGVVHRDVSPQNLLVSYEGAVKVSDFGLAKARAASAGVCSETVRGKPSYMAPEQMAGGMLDGRTDLYSVGVMLWEMLAHRPLFAGTTREVMGQVMFRAIPTPSSTRSGVPADLEAVTMKLLARDLDDRYATAEAAIGALLACTDAPRDGRGALVQLLAERFPTLAGARLQRMAALLPVPAVVPAASPAPESAPRAAAGPITIAAPPSLVAVQLPPAIGADLRPRRRFVAATVTGFVGFVLGILAAAAVIALVIR
jgi:eukaryotic-like serine/threonine-protein kinase